jgi:hypothetical protein
VPEYLLFPVHESLSRTLSIICLKRNIFIVIWGGGLRVTRILNNLLGNVKVKERYKPQINRESEMNNKGLIKGKQEQREAVDERMERREKQRNNQMKKESKRERERERD